MCGDTAYYLIAILLPKALVDQGAAVALSFGLSSLVFAASIPGKLFNGYIMEIIARRWTITGAFLLSIPGILLMMLAHRTGSAATVVFSVGALITGFTVLSCFPAVRVYLSEQSRRPCVDGGTFSVSRSVGNSPACSPYSCWHPTPPRRRYSLSRWWWWLRSVPPFPVPYARETLGQLEAFTDAMPELA